MRSGSILVIAISLGFCSCVQLDPGSTCTVEHTQYQGICKLLVECPSVTADIKQNLFSHTICGFEGKEEIVCCPEERSRRSAPPPENKSFSRISERKCDEYKSAVFEDVLSPSLLGEPTLLFVDKCAQKPISSIPDSSPSPGQYPHMALIGSAPDNEAIKWFCSGSLISDEYVLTAAHCLHSKHTKEPNYVRFSELDFNSDVTDVSPEDYTISAIILHPEFKISVRYNDIGLIKLNRKVELNPYRRPACLPRTFDTEEQKTISAGWSHDFESKVFHFQHLVLEKFTESECNDTYGPHAVQLQQGILSNTQFCAGLRGNASGFGPNDSGGPLQIHSPDLYCMYTVIGVRSFGIGITLKSPEVYTRVFPYVDWIESVVWNNS